MGNILKYYVQLAFMADKNEEVSKYLKIYEPFIRFFEIGGDVIHRSGFFEIQSDRCLASVQSTGWFKRADMEPIDIDKWYKIDN